VKAPKIKQLDGRREGGEESALFGA
jgi:hypothetical protein